LWSFCSGESLESSHTQVPSLDNLAASLGEDQAEQESPDKQMEQNGGSKCCITWAAILKLYISQMKCLTVGHGFLQETGRLLGVESVIQHCNRQAILWSWPAIFLFQV